MSETLFVTGGTGFLGSYVILELMARTDAELVLLTRANTTDEAQKKLWRAMQLHIDSDAFFDMMPRIRFAMGDLHAPKLGLSEADYDALTERCGSVLHIAASLNRKSAKACFNSNLRGTLSMIQFARAAKDRGGLRRFSWVSTTAVAGVRQSEVVGEDQSIDWNRSDYDPYARTKKFAEHMVFEMLPDIDKTVFRPSIVMGDSRMAETTQFDMVSAFVGLAKLPVVPLDPHTRLDIVPADFVGEAIARLHMKQAPRWERYHLSSGTRSACTPQQIGRALDPTGKGFRMVPRLDSSFLLGIRALNRLPRSMKLQGVGALMKVFWPYVTFDTVFDNTRVCTELDMSPTPFPAYCAPLLDFATRVKFTYPYKPLPVQRKQPAKLRAV